MTAALVLFLVPEKPPVATTDIRAGRAGTTVPVSSPAGASLQNSTSGNEEDNEDGIADRHDKAKDGLGAGGQGVLKWSAVRTQACAHSQCVSLSFLALSSLAHLSLPFCAYTQVHIFTLPSPVRSRPQTRHAHSFTRQYCACALR